MPHLDFGEFLATRWYNITLKRVAERKEKERESLKVLSVIAEDIKQVLTPDLLHPWFVIRWGRNTHPLAGHAYVASEALYHSGAEEAGFLPHSIRVLGHPGIHWFLRRYTDEAILDITAGQFPEGVDYPLARRRWFFTKEPNASTKTVLARIGVQL